MAQLVMIPLIVLQGYSYVAPSVIFSDNTISSDLLKQSKDLQPDNRQLLYASHFKVSTNRVRTGLKSP